MSSSYSLVLLRFDTAPQDHDEKRDQANEGFDFRGINPRMSPPASVRAIAFHA